jgi:hypothetical protein
LPKIEKAIVVEADARCVTCGADTRTIGMFGKQTPTLAGFAMPVGSIVEIDESPVRGRTGVAAFFPLRVNFSVAIAAVLWPGSVWLRTYPLVAFVVLGEVCLNGWMRSEAIRPGVSP